MLRIDNIAGSMLSAFHAVATLPLVITLWGRCYDYLPLMSGEIKDQSDWVAYPSVRKKISIHVVLQTASYEK